MDEDHYIPNSAASAFSIDFQNMSTTSKEGGIIANYVNCHAVCVVTCPPTLKKLSNRLHVYVGIIDPTLTDKGYQNAEWLLR